MRQRHVFPNREIGHLFIHKSQQEARNGNGNFYFKGDRCFSYGSHFIIASHVTGVEGESGLLFTSRDYSTTTSQHKSIVRRAIPADWIVFTVPNLSFGYSEAEDEHQHGENLKYHINEIAEHLGKCVRARSAYNKEWRHERAVELRLQAIAYCEFFGLPIPSIDPIPDLDSSQMAVLKVREAKAQAEKAAETRRQEEEKRKKASSLADEWRQGGRHHYLLNVLPTMLRIEDYEVVTSRGARFPITHAKRGLVLVRSVMSRGEDWSSRETRSCRLGHYSITRITADGTVYAGCHVVTWPEIERVAQQIDDYEARVKCTQCMMLSINGVPCHETGCVNSNKQWSIVENNWVEPEKEEDVEDE